MILLTIALTLAAFWGGVGLQEIDTHEAQQWTKPTFGAILIVTTVFALFLLLRGIFA